MKPHLLNRLIIFAALLAGCSGQTSHVSESATAKPKETPIVTQSADGKLEKLNLPDAEWKKRLSPEQYHVLREKGTERAFTGEFWHNERDGVYLCAACGLELYDSKNKFDSGTGWPSFWKAVDDSHIGSESDMTLGMERDELLCARCGGHLGHVFNDGPAPTGKRHCINSVSLRFEERKPAKP